MQNTTPLARQGRGLAYKWIVLGVVVLGVFMSLLDSTIVNIAIPRLQSVFGADLHTVQWVLTAYILTQGIVTPTAAFFSDRFGTKRFYIVSLIAFTVGSALCGLSWSLPVLIAFRILQGAGGAALFPLSMTLLFREFPLQERGTAMGLFGIPSLLAPALGPTLGGYLMTYTAWQAIFYINIPVGFLAVILASIFLRESERQKNRRFDIVGFCFAAIGLGSVLYVLSDASTDGWGSPKILGFLLVGVLSLALFASIELIKAQRKQQPLLDLRLFSNGPFLASMMVSVFVVFSLFGGIFIFPNYLQILRQQSAFQAGLIMLPQALAAMLSTSFGGRLVDRFGVHLVIIPGLILLALSTWLLSSLTLTTPFEQLQVLFILRGLALGVCIQPISVAAFSRVPPQQLAQGTSISTVIRAISSSLGIAVLATLMQTRTAVHYTQLAAQVTVNSPANQMLMRLRAFFVAHGVDPHAAQTQALQTMYHLLQQQAYMLAIQDAFLLTFAITILAIIATLFVRVSRRRPAGIPEEQHGGQVARGEETTARPPVFTS